MPSDPATPRFGANYVPSAGWFYSWLDYDPAAVRRDFADLAGLGLDHVRVFPIWPWIQPNRAIVRERAIADLLDTVDAAAEHGLSVAVDLVQGHLSSFDFLPSWVLTWHKASLFEDSTVRAGLKAYVQAVAGAVATKPNVFAITLGNEVNNLWPDSPTTPEASTSWAQDLLAAIRKAAPDVLALHSVFDDAWYQADHPFLPVDAVDLGDLSTVHSWVFNGVSRVDGPLGPATLTHADYLVELAAATSVDPQRPVWLQEIGVPGPDIPADLQAEFTRRTVELVLPNPKLWGVTWWSSHDIDRRLLDFPDREYDLGLFTVDHQRKPAASALAEVIADVRANGVQPVEASTLAAPVNLRTEPHRRPEVAPGSEFHLQWVAARAAGPVRITLPS
ncbi:cellulase (glycosyl hydrolase family 5) [Kribbella amoyensis]|uniref:Cellulase (Glycosyl hydrolase family 5) n=1 Tax=Kribbella amoyensis TaxID=996641 RepID=A0A561B351_9ACTN|nr:cellulase family glycosylhydrolase [Kribbella amoyensis]TWD73242.1 cellulase (glycosyl hydrolase family 5) [Kribbella amoyensis]